MFIKSCFSVFVFFQLLGPALAQGSDELIQRIDLVIESSDCQSGEQLLESSREFLVQSSDPEVQIGYHELLAMLSTCAGEIDSAIHQYRRAILLARKPKSFDRIPPFYSRIGFLFQSAGNLDSSTFYFNLGKVEAAKIPDSLMIGSCLMGIGINQQHQGKIDSALTSYFEALRIAEQVGDTRLLIAIKLNISTIYYDHQPENLRIHEFIDMLKMARKIDDKSREMSLLEWLGYLKTDSLEYDSALFYFSQGLDLSIDQKNIYSQILLMQGLTYLYDRSGQHLKSIANNNEIIGLALESGFESYLPALYANNVSNFLTLEKYTEAIQSGEEGIRAGKKNDQIELYYRVYQQLAEAYSKVGQSEKAYSYQKTFTDLSQRILDEKKTQQMNELRTRYETEKKEAEINALSQASQIQELRLQQQQNALMGLSGVVILLVGGGVLIYRQRKLKEEQRLTELELEETRKRLLLEQQSRASELKAIRSQMNPHFVFNALNSIQEYIMTNERKLAGKYLGKFADLMRMYLNHSQVRRVSLQEEIEALSLYVELETLRFGKTLKYEINVNEEVDLQIEIPSFLLQPYVENAFKHGLLHKHGERRLQVSFYQGPHQLTCEVIDNGIGRKSSRDLNIMRNPNHKSFATEAIQSRLVLLNQEQEYPITERVEDLVDETGKGVGTKVVLEIPLEAE